MTPRENSILEARFEGLTALMNAHFHNVDDRLGKIEIQTAKTNGKVEELEKKELLHIIDCPQAPKIRVLEDNQLTNKSIRRWIVASVSVTGGVLGIVAIVMKIFFNV